MRPGPTLTLLSTVRSSGVPFEEEYANDPELLAFYKKKLLVPGWAGELTSD